MKNEPIRLQKYLSDCGVMSRRAAEKEIVEGKITVNDAIAELGQKIVPGKDTVKWKGRTVKKSRSQSYTYLMLYKPAGYVTTLSDEKGRRCVKDLISDVEARVYPIGRLDRESEGLLLLTNDGALTEKLTHPKHRIPKIYEVSIKGRVTRAKLSVLSGEMTIDGYQIQPVACELLSATEESSLVRMTLYEGRNRQIRKMCEQVELEITKLKRVAIGLLDLEGVRKGRWRYLTYDEVAYLKEDA